MWRILPTNFRAKTEINNYHDDIYGDDKGIPAQGPFTERHVGGRQHRHININTSSTNTSLTRPEAWDLTPCSLCWTTIAATVSNYGKTITSTGPADAWDSIAYSY